MVLIDTHSHMYSPEFNEDIEKVIANAREANVKKIFLPNIDSESFEPMMNLVRKFPETCFPMIGLHPTSVKENYRDELVFLEKYLEKKKFYAIGETGIDLYWDKTFLKEQQEAFEIQISWALKYDLPVIIHSRESFDEIFEVLEPCQNQSLRGIFHSFTGSFMQAQKAIEMGFYIGVNGIITFKNSGMSDVIRQIEMSHLVIETDAPYLAPVPKRGKRNESSYLQFIAKKLAEIHYISIEEVAEVTTRNACTLFGI